MSDRKGSRLKRNGKPLSEDANANGKTPFVFASFFVPNYYKKRVIIFMYKVYAAILHCAEYNFEKLIKHRGKPKSPEEFLCWKLEFGIGNCVGFLLVCEKYHWNEIKCSDCRNIGIIKKAPVKLRNILFKLMNNSASVKTENERIAKLRTGIGTIVIYLRKIKNDDNYLNSIALQNVHEYLENLLEMKISPISKINKQE